MFKPFLAVLGLLFLSIGITQANSAPVCGKDNAGCLLVLTGPFALNASTTATVPEDMECGADPQKIFYTVESTVPNGVDLSMLLQTLPDNNSDGSEVEITGGTCITDISSNPVKGRVSAYGSCTINVDITPAACDDTSHSFPQTIARELVVKPNIVHPDLTAEIELTVVNTTTMAYIGRQSPSVRVCPVNSDATLNVTECFTQPVNGATSIPDVILNSSGTLAYVADDTTDLSSGNIIICPVLPGGTFGTCDPPVTNSIFYDFAFTGLRLSADNRNLFISTSAYDMVTCPLGPDGKFSTVSPCFASSHIADLLLGRVAFNAPNPSHSYIPALSGDRVWTCDSNFSNCTNATDPVGSPLGLGINASRTHVYVGQVDGFTSNLLICEINTAGVLVDCSSSPNYFNLGGLLKSFNPFMEYVSDGLEYGYIPNTNITTIAVCSLDSGELDVCTDSADLGFSPLSVWIAQVLIDPIADKDQ